MVAQLDIHRPEVPDRRATREAKELLSAIGVTLADHLLSADGRVLSLRRAGPEGRAVFDGRE